MTVPNTEQAAYWNGEEAEHWIADQTRYEQMLEPVAEILLDAAELAPGEAVLDIGCGCGSTTIAAAQAVAASGSAFGVDISAQMLDRARAVAKAKGLGNVGFEQADAQVAALQPDAYDVAISRFGVMFFEDPVAAFANIRSAAGRLAFAAWREPTENEWFNLPMRTFLQFVPPHERPSPPQGPGPFAFADAAVVREVLAKSGWGSIEVAPRDVEVMFGGRGTVDDVVRFVATGRAGKMMLAGRDEPTRQAALDALRAALVPHATADGVRMTAATWIVTARA